MVTAEVCGSELQNFGFAIKLVSCGVVKSKECSHQLVRAASLQQAVPSCLLETFAVCAMFGMHLIEYRGLV